MTEEGSMIERNKRETDADSNEEAATAVLQAIRDRLPLEDLARFGSALPAELRAMYFADWRPGERDFPAVFEEDVRARLARAGVRQNPSEAIRDTWKLIGEAIHENNLTQILPLFPPAAELPLSA